MEKRRSGRPSINFEQTVQELREMFPNHKQNVIEAILRDQKNDLDSAIAVLLNTDPNATTPPVQSPKGHSKHPDPSGQVGKQHIFPSDFLRWPSYAKAVRVPVKKSSATAGLKVAIPPRVIPPMEMVPNEDSSDSFDIENNSLSIGDEKQNAAGWARFKARFTRKAGYEQL